ncbi:MAG TPA: ABC transporter substrate-binding protein [Gaiella sp.]|nr:ABC transporter substrate-binding protein [Gaiella sp.]
MPRRFALAAFLTAVAVTVALASTALASQSRSTATPFPATITVSNGKVTIPKRPSRIVSLSATATETLFAIGAGKQVIAVDEQSDYPKSAPRTTLSGFTPNVEAIAGYRPDLVVISYDPKGLSEALGKLRIPVVHQDAAATLPGAYQQIRQLGKITGHVAEANGLVTDMKRKIAGIVAKTRTKAAGVTVYHELDPTLYTLTSNTFVGRVYAMFGLQNIADAAKGGTEYPQLSPEYVISANPGLIVLADTVCCAQNVRTVAARPGWSRIAAVRTGSVVRLDDSIASRWGPRLVNLVRAVGTALGRLGRQ